MHANNAVLANMLVTVAITGAEIEINTVISFFPLGVINATLSLDIMNTTTIRKQFRLSLSN